MASCKSVYQPQEDSSLLERYVRQHAKGKVLDIGTGSGIQAIAAAQNNNVSSVTATDLQKGVINYCKKNIKNKKIKFLQSDLFKKIKEKFDVIIFNPPYLPQELKLKDLTVEGGKKGYEVIERFLNEANNFLKQNGIVLMVFSSLTKKEKVEEFIKNNLLEFEELEKVHIFFEDIYIYLLRKNNFLKTLENLRFSGHRKSKGFSRELENKGIKNVKYLTKGHRGLLFTGLYNNKKIVIKTKNPESTAFGRIANESKWLKKLKKHKIGPKLLFFDDDYFIYEYISGDFIIDYLKKSNKDNIRKIIKNVFNQMYILDKLKIDKEEMHHPLKHILVSNSKTFLIDFERTHYVKNPKNVTQFCQFLISGYINKILANKKINVDKANIMQLAKIYKNNQNNSNFKKIISII